MSRHSFGVSNEDFPSTPLPFTRPRKLLGIDMPERDQSQREQIDPDWLPKYLASQVRMDMPGLVDDIAQARLQMRREGEQ